MKVSFEITRSGGTTDTEKAAGEKRSPLSTSTSLADRATESPFQAARASSFDAPAAGERPDPGTLPQVAPARDVAGPGDAPSNNTPVRYPFPYAVNQSLTPRGESTRLTPFQQLRAIADVLDVARIGIEARKDQMTSLKWDFAPKDRMSGKKASTAEEVQIKKLRAFFLKPDRVHNFATWLRMAIEEVIVVDALSIFRRKTRGGDLWALELIDGTTIKPLIDERGFTPAAPQVAYRQIIYGRPVVGGDCSVDQLLYRPRTVRTWTPYGLSAIECVLLTVNTALNRQVFNLNYYSEGNIPEGLMSAPEGWTTTQIREFQEYWDALLTGNTAARKRLRIVGAKMAESVHQFKKESFDTEFDEWLLRVVCAAIGVQPQEIGFTMDVNKSQGEQQENVTYRRGVKPLANFFKDIIDEVVAIDLGMPEFETVFTGGETEDRLAQARIDDIYVRIGKVSIDELRARDGEEMVGLGPMVFTNEGPVFVEQLIENKDTDPLSTAPREPDAPSEDLSTAAGAKAEQRKVGVTPGTEEADDDDDEADDEDDEKTEKAVDAELSRFKRFAMNRVAVNKRIDATRFESSTLPLDTRQTIVKAIEGHSAKLYGHDRGTKHSVADVFKAVERASSGVQVKTAATRRFKKVMKSYFGELSTALASHVADFVKGTGE